VTAQEHRPPGILPSLPATGYRALFDASPLGLSVVTLDGRIVAANAALCRMLGRSQAEVVGRTFLSMTHPDDVERNRDVYRQLVDGERSSFTVEKRFLAASGDVVWARVTVALIKDEQGVPRMAAGITEDISELRAANARAQRVQGLLHEAMHSMSDAFCVFDRDFRFVYLNPQAERDLGVDAGEMIGRVLWEEFRATADTELYEFFTGAWPRVMRRPWTRFSSPASIAGSSSEPIPRPRPCRCTSATSHSVVGRSSRQFGRSEWRASARLPGVSRTISTTCWRRS
jgi:PAS domain S-box-containing protein